MFVLFFRRYHIFVFFWPYHILGTLVFSTTVLWPVIFWQLCGSGFGTWTQPFFYRGRFYHRWHPQREAMGSLSPGFKIGYFWWFGKLKFVFLPRPSLCGRPSFSYWLQKRLTHFIQNNFFFSNKLLVMFLVNLFSTTRERGLLVLPHFSSRWSGEKDD